MWPTTISDYYRAAVEGARNEIETTPDARVLGMDPGAWSAYLVARWGMAPIVFDAAREIEMVETIREYTLRSYDIYTDQEPGTTRRETAIEIQMPVESTDTLHVIQQQELAPNTFSISHSYPPFHYDHAAGLLRQTVSADKGAIAGAMARIRDSVQGYNVSIENENTGFCSEIGRLVTSRRERLAQKHQSLDELSATVGVRLTKMADSASVVLIAPKVKAKIAPVLPPARKPQTRSVLDGNVLDVILALIDNVGRQFERTPQAFSMFAEEGLRDYVLGGLNMVFEGAAGGETFQGIGKCDIHLRIAQGEVFIAEMKFWAGPESLKEVISQLRGRLSWRDSYGVGIILSRNVKFSDVMKNVRDTVAECDGFVQGTLTARADNHTVARFTIATDETRQATFHILVYNLYSPSHGDRIVRKSN